MRFLSTFFIVFAASVLTLAVIYDIRGGGLQSLFTSKATPNGQKLLQFDLNSAQTIEIGSLSTGSYSLEKSPNINGGWELTKPVVDQVDPRRLAQIATFLTKATVIDSFPLTETSLEDFGLGKKETRIEIFDDTKTTLVSLAIGHISPWQLEIEKEKNTFLQTTVYARLLDNSQSSVAYVLDDPGQNITRLLGSNVKRLRDHHPFLCFPSEISQISLRSAGSQILIERETPKSPWRITKPLELKTDPAAIKNLIHAIVKLEAIDLLSSEEAPPQIEESPYSISIKTFSNQADAPPIELQLLTSLTEGTHNTESIPARVSNRDATFLLPINSTGTAAGLSAFPKSVNPLRYQALAAIHPKGLKSIIIRGPSREDILLTRESPEDDWQQLGKKDLQDIDEQTLYNFLVALNQTPVEGFISDAATDLSKWGLNKPDLGIAFIGFNEKAFRIAFKRSEGGKVLAARIGEPHLKQVNKDAFRAISPPAKAWRNKRLWSINRVDIQNILFQKNGEEAVNLKYNFFTEEWSAKIKEADKTADLIPARANKLLERLEDIHVLHWLDKRNKQAFEALLEPEFIADITVDDIDSGENTTRSLRLTPISKNSSNQFFYGHLSGESDYFILDLNTYNALSIQLFENE